MRLERLKLLGSRFAFIPVLQGHKIGRGVTGTNETKQTETDEAGRVLNAGRIHQNFLHLSRNGGRTFHGSSVGQLHIDVGVPLIFAREETRGHALGEESRRSGKSHQQYNHHDRFSEQYSAPANIPIRSLLENAVEPVEKSSQ